MAPRRKQLTNRLRRSARMRHATVKRALAADPDRIEPSVPRRPGVEQIAPTPATDAVLAAETRGPLRVSIRKVSWLAGIMVVVAGVIVVSMLWFNRASDPTANLVPVLLLVGATTLALTVLLLLKGWHQSRMAFIQLTPSQRRLVRAVGPLAVQERLDLVNASEYWLRPQGSGWMSIDRNTFRDIEPLLLATQRNDLRVSRTTGNDVANDWAIAEARILYFPLPAVGVVVEIHDADGELVYRHPRYRPDDD